MNLKLGLCLALATTDYTCAEPNPNFARTGGGDQTPIDKVQVNILVSQSERADFESLLQLHSGAAGNSVAYQLFSYPTAIKLETIQGACAVVEAALSRDYLSANKPDEIWIYRRGQEKPVEYVACPRFALILYAGGITPLMTLAIRTSDTLKQVFGRTGWLGPYQQFEELCGKVIPDSEGGVLGDCQSFAGYPVIKKATRTPGCNENSPCYRDEYYRTVLRFIPKNAGTFAGYQNNWWKYIHPYREEDREFRYPDPKKATGECAKIKDRQTCLQSGVEETSCLWIGLNCFEPGTQPGQVDPERGRRMIDSKKASGEF